MGQHNKWHKVIIKHSLWLCLFLSSALAAQEINLIGVKSRGIPGNKAQIQLDFSAVPPMPDSFSMDEPAKLVFDFEQVKNVLSRKESSQKLSLGVMKGTHFIDTDDKTRLIVDVLNVVPFNIDMDGKSIIITLDSDIKVEPSVSAQSVNTITSLDFHRGDAGEGRLVIDLSEESVPIDFREEENQIVVEFRGATVPDMLLRRFDVRDFGTPIQRISVQRSGPDVVMTIQAIGDYEKIAYQLENQYVVEARPMTAQQKLLLKSQKFKYTGERISLNFQDIEVRVVLQLMADFTGLNIVTSDTVDGKVTLRLENVPWDQALDFILKSKGLGKRESGNVILIAPNEEITEREEIELSAMSQAASLAPLRSEFIQVNYAKASDMVKMLKDKDNAMVSSRGAVSVDERTNILLVKDTEEKLIEIKRLLERLDVPVRQVLIEAQIVQTTDNFRDALGVQFAGALTPTIGRYQLGVGHNKTDARTFADNKGSKVSTGQFFNFSEGDATAQIGFALAKLPGGTLLDLELQAAEHEDKGKIIARPKLMTLDQQPATIETGTEIPYTATAQGGASPSTTFKKAVVKLEVTPQITPNDKISMEVSMNQDKPGNNINGQAAIDTTSIKTTVLVDNGETVVLGGIFKVDQSGGKRKVPFFGDIPVLGRFFRAENSKNNRDEVLIFITPRIVKSFLG